MPPSGNSYDDETDDGVEPIPAGRPTFRLNFARRLPVERSLGTSRVKKSTVAPSTTARATATVSSTGMRWGSVAHGKATKRPTKLEEDIPKASGSGVLSPNNGSSVRGTVTGSRKHSRKEVLASISLGVHINKKKIVAPIPSFKSDSELERLERAFFDDDDDDGGGEDAGEKRDEDDNAKRGSRDVTRHRNNEKLTATTKNTMKDEFAFLMLSSDEDAENSDDANMIGVTRRTFPNNKSLTTKADAMTGDATCGKKSTSPQHEQLGRPNSMVRKRDSTPSEVTDTIKIVSHFSGKASRTRKRSSTSTDARGPSAATGRSEVSGEPHAKLSAKLQAIEAANPTLKEDHDDKNDVIDNVAIEPDCDVREENSSGKETGARKISLHRDAKLKCLDSGTTGTQALVTAVDRDTVPKQLVQPAYGDTTANQPPLDTAIEIEVDRIFVKSDIASVTMNGFCRALEMQMNIKLDKATAKLVKKRVLDLINGVVTPLPTKSNVTLGHSIPTAENMPPAGNDVTAAQAAPFPALKGPDPQQQGLMNQEDQEVKTTIREESIVQNDRIATEAPSGNNAVEGCDEHKGAVSRTDTETEPGASTTNHCDNKLTISDVQSSASISVNPPISKSNKIKPKKCAAKDHKHESTSIGKSPTVQLERATNEDAQPEPGKPDPRPSSKDHKHESTSIGKSPIAQLERATNEDAQPEPSKPDPRPRARLGRRRQVQAEVRDGQITKDSGENPETSAQAPAVSARSQKRVRKIACALCKTCPCQKANSSDTATTLDMKESFSRSDAAVERALIRRMQKLEKSAENLQEQTEFIRRKLKKHRRDIWKRRERESLIRNQQSSMFMSSAGGAADSWFLPDAEIFERQQRESQCLHQELVQTATLRVFDKPATYQPTLTQMMGHAKKKEEKSLDPTNTSGTVNEPLNDTVKGGQNVVLAVIDENDPLPDEDVSDDAQIEYLPEPRDVEDKISRILWKPKSEHPTVDVPSIWDSIPAMTQDVLDRAVKTGTGSVYQCLSDSRRYGSSSSSWDELFLSKDEIEDEGLDDLLNLFKDNRVSSEVAATKRQEVRSDSHKDPTSLAMLSPGAKRIASEIITNIAAKEEKVKAIEQSCPNWKENVAFALSQKDPGDIQGALHSVKESREHMQTMKRRILQAWERQNMALALFEAALEASAVRLTPGPQVPLAQDGDGGFLTQVDNSDCGSQDDANDDDALFRDPVVDLCVASQ